MSCPSVWDGVDFSACFREKYIENSPLVLTAFGAAVVVLCCRKRPFQSFSTNDLVSPNGDNISRLEADVLMATVAETVLPPLDRAVEASEPTPLPPKEADKIVNDFRRTTTKSSRNWDFVYRSASVIGAAAWCLAQGAAVTWSQEDGRALVFPVCLPQSLSQRLADNSGLCFHRLPRRSSPAWPSPPPPYHTRPHSGPPPFPQRCHPRRIVSHPRTDMRPAALLVYAYVHPIL